MKYSYNILILILIFIFILIFTFTLTFKKIQNGFQNYTTQWSSDLIKDLTFIIKRLIKI